MSSSTRALRGHPLPPPAVRAAGREDPVRHHARRRGTRTATAWSGSAGPPRPPPTPASAPAVPRRPARPAPRGPRRGRRAAGATASRTRRRRAPGSAAAAGRAPAAIARTTRRSAANSRSMYQFSASGSASSRSVSARRRAVDDDHVPAPGPDLVAHLEQREHLLGTRQHGQLLGLDRVDARQRPAPTAGSPGCRPRTARTAAGRRPAGRTAGRRPRSARRRPATSKASASECAASVDSTSVRRRAQRAEGGRTGGRRGLPHAALAGVEEYSPAMLSVVRPPARSGLDALLQALQRGVDDHLLGLALQHADHRDARCRRPAGRSPRCCRRGPSAGRRRPCP